MKFELDIEEIVNSINMKNLVTEKITDSSEFDDLINDLFDNDEFNEPVKKKILGLTTEYLNSDDGRKYITEKITTYIDELDISDVVDINDIIGTFLKESINVTLKK